MAEWPEYFEDHPEEDPANYVGNRFDPEGAAALRAQAAKTAQEQAKLDAEISSIINKHSRQEVPGKK